MKNFIKKFFSTKKTREEINSAVNGFKALSIKQKMLFTMATIIPMGLCFWGLALVENTPWVNLFAVGAALVGIISIKILAKDETPAIKLLTNSLFTAIVSFAATTIWCVSTDGALDRGHDSALANMAMGYLFIVLGELIIAGFLDYSNKSKLAKVIFVLGITFFGLLGSCIIYEGIDDLFVIPAWIDTTVYVLSHISVMILLVVLVLLTVRLATLKLENNKISGYRWGKRFATMSIAFTAIGAGGAYLSDLFNWSYKYNMSLGTICGTIVFVGIILTAVSGMVGSVQDSRRSRNA